MDVVAGGSEFDFAAICEKLRVLDLSGEIIQMDMLEGPGEEMEVEAVGVGIVGISAVEWCGVIGGCLSAAVDGA